MAAVAEPMLPFPRMLTCAMTMLLSLLVAATTFQRTRPGYPLQRFLREAVTSGTPGGRSGTDPPWRRARTAMAVLPRPLDPSNPPFHDRPGAPTSERCAAGARA